MQVLKLSKNERPRGLWITAASRAGTVLERKIQSIGKKRRRMVLGSEEKPTSRLWGRRACGCGSHGSAEEQQGAMTGGPCNGSWVAESQSGPGFDWHQCP